MTTTRAAIWARVSTDEQEVDNQLPALEAFCQARGFEVTRRFVLTNQSAYDGNGAYKETLNALLDAAYRGEFDTVITWSLDRICRQGVEEMLRLVRQLQERGVRLQSLQEPWMDGSGPTVELLMALFAWVARMESQRRGERVRAGLARRRAEGKPVGGRKTGAKDRRPRSTDGYRLAWARRKAEGREEI